MRLEPESMTIKHSRAKVIALHWKRPWGVVLPWVWLYEAYGLIPGTNIHDVKYAAEVVIQAVVRKDGDVSELMELGRASFDLGEHRISKKAKEAPKKTDKDSRPYFAWPAQTPIALNVTVKITETNSAGKSLTTLGGWIEKNTDKLAKEVATAAGFE
jgi:hypothetical protein